MRFKTDENLPREVADYLVQSGHDALRVDEQGLAGVADPGVAAVCLVERRAIVTLDTDFMDIRRFPPEQYSQGTSGVGSGDNERDRHTADPR